MANSTASTKPNKPYPDFPLYPHDTKRWAKKIKGRTHYFGPWDNWQAALERFQYENDYLQAGRTPPPRDQMALTVGEMVNSMLEHREAKLDSGELSPLTFADYKRMGKKLIDVLGRHAAVEGLQPCDFAKLRKEIAGRGGLLNLASEMTKMKSFFNHAVENFRVHAHFGSMFDKPSKKAIRLERQTKVEKIFDIEELRTLYHAAGPQMRAFMLLALNGALGNADIGQLKFKHVQGSWIDYPRPKTGVERKFPMWKETAKAIQEATQSRHPELDLVFVTKYGQSWFKDTADSPMSKEFRKLCIECNIHLIGRGFYALRHTFRTVADGCHDAVAVGHIMGHSDESMAANYTHWIEPERLQAVVDHVYAWVKPMFNKPAKKAGAK